MDKLPIIGISQGDVNGIGLDLRKSKDSSWSMPPTPQGRMTDREQALPRFSHSADRPKHNIIGLNCVSSQEQVVHAVTE